MTKEHMIGELYIRNLELFKAHQTLQIENKQLQQELNMLQSILTTKENSEQRVAKVDDVALAKPSKDSQELNVNRNQES